MLLDTGDDYRLENEQDRISSAEPDTVPFDRTLFPDYDKSKEVTAQIFRSTVQVLHRTKMTKHVRSCDFGNKKKIRHF